VPRLQADYHPDVVQASLSVLVELATMLRSYGDALVLIGGWVPYFILEQYGEKQTEFTHVGSIDVDLVIDPDIVTEDVYLTMTELLLERGYHPSPDILYQFSRTVISPASGAHYTIGVDFLTPRPPRGQGRKHRHRRIQPGLKARTLEGAEVALHYNFPVQILGLLPGNGRTEVIINVADVVACLALKGIALGERYREKDAYDIYAVCAYHDGGPVAVANRLRPALYSPVLERGLVGIADRFESADAEGPWWVANFLSRDDPDQHARLRQDAFMTVREVIRLLENGSGS
jgi:hypothetical protein